MSVGSVGKWLSMGLLVASLGAVGCGDDDEKPKDAGGGGTPDAGGGDEDASTSDGGGGSMDGGTPEGGGGNSCPDSPGSMNACCNVDGASKLCTYFQGGLGPVVAGCAKNTAGAEVCGISSNIVLMGAEPKFFEKDAPGVPSSSCAAFYDALERGPDGGAGEFRGNGAIDSVRMIGATSFKLRYAGCCSAAGLCTINGTDGGADTQGTGTYGASNNGYGCLAPAYAFGAYPEDAGPALGNANLRAIPCDPATGMIKFTPPSPDAGGGDAGASDASADAAGG